jgi:hypothetical protein
VTGNLKCTALKGYVSLLRGSEEGRESDFEKRYRSIKYSRRVQTLVVWMTARGATELDDETGRRDDLPILLCSGARAHMAICSPSVAEKRAIPKTTLADGD